MTLLSINGIDKTLIAVTSPNLRLYLLKENNVKSVCMCKIAIRL